MGIGDVLAIVLLALLIAAFCWGHSNTEAALQRQADRRAWDEIDHVTRKRGE